MSFLITEKYNYFFNSKGIRRITFIVLNFFGFLRDIKKYQKFSELKSFFIWEAKSKLNIWKDYLAINKNCSVIISDSNLSSLSLHTNNSVNKSKIKFELTKIEAEWNIICIVSDGSIIGNTVSESNILFRGNKNGFITEVLFEFDNPVESIYINSINTIFLCSSGSIFRSDKSWKNFKKVLDLSSRKSKFLFHVGMTEIIPEILLIGEYSNIWDKKTGWKNSSNLYISYDEGVNWQRTNFLKKCGVNKHIHIIKYIKNLKMLVLTDGDNKKQLWTNKVNGNLYSKNHFSEITNWKLLTKKHTDFGGYSSVLELNNKILFGTDYFGGTNFLVETEDFETFKKKVIPDPYRRGHIDCLSKTKDIVWASIKPPKFSNSKGLIMYNTINSEEWYKLFDYDYNNCTVEIISKGQSEEYQDYMFLSVLANNQYKVLRLEQIQ